MPKVKFNNENHLFYRELNAEVDSYFVQHNQRKTGNWKLYFKTALLIPAAFSIYLLLIFAHIPAVPAILLSGALGFILASIGFNVMHDACHGSYSQKDWVNQMMGLTLNALGGNAFIWKFKHNIIHHTYTNVDGMDDDIAKSPIMRQCSTQKWVPAHRFQHYYIILVYAISSFAWVFLMDFNKYFRRKILQTPLQKMKTSDHWIFWISKFSYFLFYIAIPVYFLGWVPWIIGFAMMHLIMGLTLAIVFQLAHVVENASFEYAGPPSGKRIETEWAVHQVRTTANFASKNPFISWWVGGLNFQVEHHLFPRISHIHYPALHPIVKRICLKHNIDFNEFPSMGKAIISHFRMMKQLGRRPAPVLKTTL